MCEFCTKIPAFYRRLWLAAPLFGSYFADIQGEKIFSWSSSLRKVRSISEIGVDSFVYFTVDKQREGKKQNETQAEVVHFYWSLFVFCLNRAFYSNSFISSCTFRRKKKLFVIPGLPNIFTLITFCTIRFYEYTSFFCHFAVCSDMDNRKTG